MATNKELTLIIQPKVIDHLGIKMYQKPVDVISEFVANAWDADSETDVGSWAPVGDSGRGLPEPGPLALRGDGHLARCRPDSQGQDWLARARVRQHEEPRRRRAHPSRRTG